VPAGAGWRSGAPLTPRGRAQVQLALIQQLLPEEMLATVLGHLSAYDLGAVACACRGWRAAAHNPALWRAACTRAFPGLLPDALARAARLNHRCGARRAARAGGAVGCRPVRQPAPHSCSSRPPGARARRAALTAGARAQSRGAAERRGSDVPGCGTLAPLVTCTAGSARARGFPTSSAGGALGAAHC